jgi:ribosome recycling factor
VNRTPCTSLDRTISPPARAFSTSQWLQKRGSRTVREEKPATSKGQAGDDPYDLSALGADIAAATERLKDDLSKLRAGGRFNPQVLENLRVQPDKKSKETYKINDLAQVIPKGRTVQILVGEQDVRCRFCPLPVIQVSTNSF